VATHRLSSVPLSEDKKAILRLLAQRGAQGYADLAALMGISEAEVHARAREAASELEGEGIPAPAIPDPSGAAGGEGAPSGGSRLGELPAEGAPSPRSAAVGTGRTEPDIAKLEGRQAEEKAPVERPAAAASAPSRERTSSGPLVRLPKGREGRMALGAAVAIAVVALIVVLFNGDGDDPEPSGDGAPAAATAGDTGPEGKPVTQAVLNPVDGSEATGVAIFGRVKNKLALQVTAEGLEPTGETDSYTVWLAASPQRMLPLANSEVGKDGRINAQVEVPTEVLAYLADETFGQIAVTRTDEARLQSSLTKAAKDKEAPAYTGDEVLRGVVTGPIVGAAKRDGE
jgi:hypothetical protein